MVRESRVCIELTADEALVLFDWLARFNQSDKSTFEDTAEQRVLFDLESKLESSLALAFEPNYKGLLADARDRLRDAE
jgi:hypothetical protein